MKKYTMVVLTNPVEGREDEYNDWYQNIHLDQVCALKGFKSAERYRLAVNMGEGDNYGYMAIYGLETDDLNESLQQLQDKSGTPELILTEAMDAEKVYAVVYEEFGAKVTSAD